MAWRCLKSWPVHASAFQPWKLMQSRACVLVRFCVWKYGGPPKSLQRMGNTHELWNESLLSNANTRHHAARPVDPHTTLYSLCSRLLPAGSLAHLPLVTRAMRRNTAPSPGTSQQRVWAPWSPITRAAVTISPSPNPRSWSLWWGPVKTAQTSTWRRTRWLISVVAKGWKCEVFFFFCKASVNSAQSWASVYTPNTTTQHTCNTLSASLTMYLNYERRCVFWNTVLPILYDVHNIFSILKTVIVVSQKESSPAIGMHRSKSKHELKLLEKIPENAEATVVLVGKILQHTLNDLFSYYFITVIWPKR